MDGHTQLGVWVEDAIKAALDAEKDATGVPIAAQVRFALLEWLESKGHNPLGLPKRKSR